MEASRLVKYELLKGKIRKEGQVLKLEGFTKAVFVG